MSIELTLVRPGDWNGIRRNFQEIDSAIGLGASSKPTYAGLTLTGLTASSLVSTDSSKALASVTDLTTWIAGTTNRVTVADDGDGTITLSAPQDIHTGASPTFVKINCT
ncbi:MAG: hypothetical protein GWN67_20480, partial [Phycisphaerae bacterium]|nr:hypothetical protein [Fodinibius sp.]NIU58672.1 hypothetical protein [Phycisphaerae bacterium]NIV16161.1 hypothetical protein [Fodinibius sp.]NIW94958.1 hypothetical protein [Phycisphaerae bacterium]NIY30142.1 hypothetical protein [Fodinibius sp.]